MWLWREMSQQQLEGLQGTFPFNAIRGSTKTANLAIITPDMHKFSAVEMSVITNQDF